MSDFLLVINLFSEIVLIRGCGVYPRGGEHGSTPYKYMKIYIYSSKCDFPGGEVLSSTYFTEEGPPITCRESPLTKVLLKLLLQLLNL